VQNLIRTKLPSNLKPTIHEYVHLVTRGHFRSRERWRSHHSIRHIRKSTLYANFISLCFIKLELLPIEVSHCGNRDFLPFFAHVTLTSWPNDFYIRTWPVFPGSIPDMPVWTSTSRLSKSIARQKDRQTNRQTDIDQIYIPRHFAGG